jgi:G3E family GTPase
VSRVPVSIVSGFLGAGKTTAIRAQLEQRTNEKVAVIVNDFGEASLDEVALAEGQPFRITNIPGGCVCCTAPEGFVDALGAVLAQRPDRLIIEPTGLARPQDLIDTIRRCAHADALELAPVVVVIDPGQFARKDSSALMREQAQAADVLVANRSDLASEAELAAFDRYAAELWPAPLAVVRTRHGALARELLDWPAGEGPHRVPSREHVHHHEPSTEGHHARSWQWSPDVIFSGQRLRDALARLAGDSSVARLKGIFRTEEGVSRLEIAGGTLHDRLTSFRRDSRCDAIARGDASALDRVGAALEAAMLRDEERQRDPNRIELVLPDGRVHVVDRAELIALPGGIPNVSGQFPKRSGSAARLDPLFETLAVPASGTAVVVAGDGFASEPVSIAVLRHGVLLHTLEGAPLPADQGGPFRLLIPQEASPDPISCANVKGVAKIVIRN